MALINRTYTFTDGTTAFGSQVDSEIANIVNTINNLDTASTTWDNVKTASITPTANINWASYKITNLGTPTVSTDATTKGYVDAIAPIGTILDYGGTAAPANYLLCDGTAYNRTTYAGLYAVISTTWGVGDGSTTFNVPNLNRRVTMGSGGSGTGTIGNAVGNTGGEENHTLITAEMPSHNHTITDPQHNHATPLGNGSGSSGTGINANQDNGTHNNGSSTTTSVATGITINNNGSGTAHNVIQPAAIVLKIIRYQ